MAEKALLGQFGLQPIMGGNLVRQRGDAAELPSATFEFPQSAEKCSRMERVDLDSLLQGRHGACRPVANSASG